MSAVISSCGQYRYHLQRAGSLIATRGPAVFIMLNPSTADGDLDDSTIRRCKVFADSWRCDGIGVVNLYALRATDPRRLWKHVDPVGPENDRWLCRVAHGAGEVVCAWGANAKPERVSMVVDILRGAGADLRCLGITKHGAPRHPLYVRGDQQLIEWNPA